MDGNLAALRQHERDIDNQERKEEFIGARADEIGAKLRQQQLVKINGDKHLYHIDDFIADDVFNTGPVCSLLSGNSEQLEQELTEKFGAWCHELAEKDIDNEEPPERDYDTREEYEGDM